MASSPAVLREAMATEAFQELVRECSSFLLADLMRKLDLSS
ncbi:hypothetical protein ACP4OV_023329 [Aristida adscensionis]